MDGIIIRSKVHGMNYLENLLLQLVICLVVGLEDQSVCCMDPVVLGDDGSSGTDGMLWVGSRVDGDWMCHSSQEEVCGRGYGEV